MGDFSADFRHKKNKNKNKLVVLCLCVCVSLNKYGLKKPGDFTMSEGHEYPLVYLYNILGVCLSGRPFHPSVSSSVVIRPIIRPDDGH